MAGVFGAGVDSDDVSGLAFVEDKLLPLGVVGLGRVLEVSVEEALVAAVVGDGVAVAVHAEVVDGKAPLAREVADGEGH